MKEVYFRYLELLHENAPLDSTTELDRDTQELLNIISLQHHKNRSLTVTDAMRMTTIASPASVHRKLNKLRDEGYIDGFYKGKNRRTQYLRPLTKAEILFDERGKILLKVLSTEKETPKEITNTSEFHC